MIPLSYSDDMMVETSPSIKEKCASKGCMLKSPRMRIVIIVVVTAVLAIVIGFLIGYFVPKPRKEDSDEERKDMHDKFESLVSAEELERELRFFTSEPHVTGSKRHNTLIDHMETKWREYGFDVEIPEYQVLLSVPQVDQPNTVEILDNGVVKHTILGKINVTTKAEPKRSFPYFPFIAYAPPGDVEGELVYCNAGQEDDLLMLDRMNISVKDRIVLLKGHGAAITGMYRLSRNETDLPSIPVQPISYEDASNLLNRLGGDEVPWDWRGTLNVTYRFGPGFTKPGTKVRLRVHNKLEVRSIYNVIGTMSGQEEPDRYVLVGNHRDAIFFGAADASSGSATLMEVARLLGELKNDGWRPRRTIKLCSWGAEEFGLIGSVEWVEEHTKLLMDRAVVYWNTDVAVGGNYVLIAQACPILAEAIFQRMKKINGPDKKTLYNSLLEKFSKSVDNPEEPWTIPYLFFSDYLPFYMSIGVPAADFSYFYGDEKNGMSLYPVYHTQEDSYYWIKKFVDPEFAYLSTMTKLIGGLALDFSDTAVLNFNVLRYAKAVKKSFKEIDVMMGSLNVSTTFVHHALEKFMKASTLFHSEKNKLAGDEGQLVLRRINDQMVRVERAFISPYLRLDDPMMQHVYSRNFQGKSFPGVIEAMERGNAAEVKKQLSLVAEAVLSAADIIRPVVSSKQGGK